MMRACVALVLLLLAGQVLAQPPSQNAVDQRIRLLIGDLTVQNTVMAVEVERLRADIDRLKRENAELMAKQK